MHVLNTKSLWALLSILDFCTPNWNMQGAVPGINCGISEPFRIIEKGKKYTGPFLPCMLIDDYNTIAEYEKTVPYWDEHQPWSECTKTCGGGTKSRTRNCFVDKKLVDPSECAGSTEQISSCNKDLCTIPQPWGQWSDCSTTCGEGVQTRIRTCLDTVANVNVPFKHCKNSEEKDTKVCGSGIPCNGWTTWSEWSLCPYGVTGVQRNKTRKCMNGDSGQVDPSFCQGTAADALQVETCPPLKSCPSDHPHAFADGLSCCKVFYRSNISSVCDGNFLQLSDPLECCPDNENIDCANEPGHCQDNAIAPTFCPANPGATRSGNDALIPAPGTLPMINASSYCGDFQKGGLLKTLDVTLLEAFRAGLTSFPYTFWMGLEKTLGSTCSGAACVNNPQVLWEDGSMMLTIPSDVTINLAATSSCVKMAMTNANPKFIVSQEPCTNNLNGVCQISCRLTESGKCPSTHPFAISNGQKCCSDFRKTFQPYLDSTCDGSKISRQDSEDCCPDSIPCPGGNNCQDRPRSGSFCPAMPNLARSGDFAFPRSPNTLNSQSNKDFCWNNYNSSLVMLKSIWDAEAILRGMTGSTINMHVNSAFFREKICTNKAACLSPAFNFQWADGTPIQDLPYNTFSIASNLHTRLVLTLNGNNGAISVTGGLSTDAEVATCQVYCSFSMASCPREYPFATQSGGACSKHFTRSHNQTINPICDGSNLAFDDPPECCQTCVPCPKSNALCQDAPNAKEFCPTNPLAIRYGDAGYIMYKHPSLMVNSTDNLKFCQATHNATMISTINQEVNQLVKFHTDHVWYYLGIDKGYMSFCNNDECLNNEDFIWHNGSTIKERNGIDIDLSILGICPFVTSVDTIKGGVCSVAVPAVCEVSCRGSDPKFCPNEHPFATNNGKSCCSDFKKKFDLATDSACDGTDLTFGDSDVCCFDPVPCEDLVNGCQNSHNARIFCPAHQGLRRSRDMAVRWDTNTPMYYYEAQEYCANTFGGVLPTFKSLFDIEYVQEFSLSRRFYVNAIFPPGITCGGDECYTSANNVSWADGSPLKKMYAAKINIWAHSRVLTIVLPSEKSTIQYYGSRKEDEYQVNCQFSCSKATPNCPSGYPLATGLGGAKCSRNPWKLNDINVNPDCDGSKLTIDDPIECCQDCIDCPGNFTKCQNSPAIDWFCFGHPKASRYGPTGFIYLPNVGKLNRTEAGKSCHAEGGRLPILNSADKLEGLENFLYSRGLSGVTVWTGLESSFAESCSNEGCVNSTILEWSDGSKVVNTEPTKLSIGRDRCVSFVQSTLSMASVDCSTKYDVVCEVDCDQQITPCPMDHPFPIGDGTFCCNDYSKKFDATTNDLCDGSAFTDEDPKECCPDPIPCSKDRCTLNTLNKEFCPRYPESTRFGHATFRMIGASSWDNAIVQCQNQFNASILSLDHPQVVSYLLSQSPLAGVNVWTNFRVESGRLDSCAPSECFDKERRLVWGNGRPFVRFPRFSLSVNYLADWPLHVTATLSSMAQKAATSALQSVCQLECSISPALCPSDYPFATARGRQCSKYYERKDLGGVPCDGGLLEKTDPIECCISCVPCPVNDRPCIDAVKAQEYCPTTPSGVRSSNHAGFTRTNRTTGAIGWWQAQQHCVDNFQGHLPFVKNMQDKIIMTRFYAYIVYIWLGGIATYGASGPSACQPPNECSWLDGSSVDLSLYKQFALEAGHKTLSFFSDKAVDNVFIVKQGHIPTEIVCQTSCSFYQDRQLCPTTHPFAFDHGHKCCGHFTQTTLNGCAGNPLDFEDPVECCSNSISCSDLTRGCKSHPNQMLLCPPYPGALRMGNKAYEPISMPSQTYNEAKTTCEAKGGILPIVKNSKEFENHAFALWIMGATRTTYWTSLKQSNNPQACLNAACNAQDIQWADGSRFAYADLNKPITGRSTETCFAIAPNLGLPSSWGFAGLNCNTKQTVICEYSCS